MSFNFKQWLPHLGVILAFVAAAFIYNSPILTGKALRMDDMVQVAGMSKEANDYKASEGRYPKWTNGLFGGMPTYQIAMEVENMWIAKLGGLIHKVLPRPVNLMVLYFAGFYLLMVLLGFNLWLSLLGAFAFGLSTYNIIIIDAGHITKAIAIGFIPPVIAGLILLFRGKLLTGFALLSFFMALQIYANHYQITYYLGMLIGIYILVKAIEAAKAGALLPFLKPLGLSVAALVLAIGASFTTFSLTNEYSKETMRGGSELRDANDPGARGLDKDYALRWSYGVAETFTLLIPNFHGGASGGDLGTSSNTYETLIKGGVPRNQAAQFVKQAPTYFGDQPGVAGPTYFGAIIVFLFILGMIVVQGSARWWLGAAALLSIVLSWGKNFELVTDIFFNYIPYYNKFRAVAMSLVIASFAFPLMAVIFLRKFSEGAIAPDKLKKGLVYATAGVGGFCLLFVLAPTSFFDFSSPADGSFNNFPGLVDALMDDRAAILRKDAIKSLILVLLAAGSLWFAMQKKLSITNMVLILLAANTIDLWVTNKRYLNEDDFVNKRLVEQPFEPNAADMRILQDTSLYYRVFDLGNRNPFNENRASFFHKSVGGYHAAKLSRYEDVKVTWLEKFNMNVLNAFNTRWIIVSQEGQGPVPQFNPDANGNAWMVEHYIIVPDAKAEIDTIGNTNLRRTAIIDQRFAKAVSEKNFVTDSAAAIQLTAYHPERLDYSFSANSEQLVVFSEIYYDKGWKAYLNDTEVPHFRANYLFRAMVVPAGEHQISFRFEPDTYVMAEKVSLAANIMLLLLCLSAIVIPLRKKG
ncbi:MAG: YfhO family protein [Bacteroidia bacterium]